MKTPITTNKRSRAGSALVLTAVLACFCGAVLVTYLMVSQNEYFLVARSQTWNSSLALTVSGQLKPASDGQFKTGHLK